MSEQTVIPSRTKLPEGWQWANWSKQDQSKAFWNELSEKSRQQVIHRLKEVLAAESQGKRLHHTKNFYDGPIGKGKVVQPSPGLRIWHFRDGTQRLVSHITPKDDDHKAQVATALQARSEHLGTKQK